ncbi:PREDICTED: uncharacterized protein C1orf112-like isoform X2 [Amphimedon queenslandica]|uniref:Uncharacterized protein n=1 Tax=Amphimedon queenslandica TaxID=400682 RepID=A0A1X7U1H6_AMPQE|nr:PREDICTED: uncharacterized protein C1orf112-like isoform X2 [Amphimedon queenslandica]|eukprot:XP_019856682.1 PREDICTED: uncharacterized protein C1orf112-like isoform X2 [Amphimedon queenslandica]
MNVRDSNLKSGDSESQLQCLLSSLEDQSLAVNSPDLLPAIQGSHHQIVECFGFLVDSLRGLLSTGGNEAAGEKCQCMNTIVNSLSVVLMNIKQSVQQSINNNNNDTSLMTSLSLMLSVILKIILMILKLCKDIETNHESSFESLAAGLGSLFKSTVSLLKATCEGVELVKPHPLTEDRSDSAIKNVLSSLFPVVQLSLQFDPTLLLISWKSLGKLVCHLKDAPRLLGNDCHAYYEMIQELCNAILIKGRETIDTGINNNNDDGGGQSSSELANLFSRLLKLCRFFASLIVRIVQEYDNYHHIISETVFNFLLELISLLPPSPSCSKAIPKPVLLQLEANIPVVLEPLFSCLMNCEEFLNLLTTSSELTSRYSYSWCYLICLLLKSFQKLEAPSRTYLLEPITAQESTSNDTNRILRAVFHCTSSCHVEFSLPVSLPGIVSIGQPLVEVSLYEHLCVHVCSLVALMPAEYFQQLERVLLYNLFSEDFYCSLLSADLWSFMARWSTSEVCYSHVKLLSDLVLVIPDSASSHTINNVKCLFWRLFAFLTPQQQELLLHKFTPVSSNNVHFWSTVPVSALTSSSAKNFSTLLFDYCMDTLKKDDHSSTTTIHCLRIIYNTLSSTQCRPHLLTHLPPLIDVIIKLMSFCVTKTTEKQLKSDYNGTAISDHSLSVAALLLNDMNKEQIIKVLHSTYWLIANSLSTNSPLPVAGIYSLLHSCGPLNHHDLKETLCALFNTLLSAELPWLPKQLVLESFKHFAEVTPFSDILEKCIPESVSSFVIDFIQKIPHGCNGHPELLETSNIIKVLSDQRQYLLKGKVEQTEDQESIVEAEPTNTAMEIEGNGITNVSSDNITDQDILSDFSSSWSQLQSSISDTSSLTPLMRSELTKIWNELGEYLKTKHDDK